MIRTVSSVRQAPRPTASQPVAGPAARPTSGTAAPGASRQAPLSPQKYKEDVIRLGSQVAAALEQLRAARQVPGSAHHHQAVVRLADAVARVEALKRIETPVNWKWFHNMDRCVRENLPELPEWAQAELNGVATPAPAPSAPVRRPTGTLTRDLKSATDALERARKLVKQAGAPEEVEACLRKAVPLASCEEALAIFDAVEGFPTDYKAALNRVRQAAVQQAVQSLTRPEAAPGVRARLGKLYPDAGRSEAVRDLEHQLMKQVASQQNTLPDVLQLATKASWEIDRVKGTATAGVALDRARELATGAGEAIAILDAIEALPYPFDKRKLTGEKRKTLAMAQSLPASVAEATSLRQRAARLPAEV